MTWESLLAQRRVERQPGTRREVADQRALAARALADAALKAVSDDGRFGRAYDAARSLASAVVRASGYRVKALGGAHVNTFAALEAADPQQFGRYAAYFDICREKRNELSYVAPGIVLRSEVDEIVREVTAFRRVVDRWLRERHADLV